MKDILKKSIKKGVSYTEYRSLVKNLLKENKATGTTQNEDLVAYSILNDKRMDRLDKKLNITPENKLFLSTIKSKVYFLVLAEGWCGDAAQILPVIAKIAEENSAIDLKVVLRDENEELMNLFLTNGGKAIPKLIILNQEQNFVESWGPRPAVATKMVADYKAKHGKIDSEFKKDLQLWYNTDKGVSTQNDIVHILKATL